MEEKDMVGWAKAEVIFIQYDMNNMLIKIGRQQKYI